MNSEEKVMHALAAAEAHARLTLDAVGALEKLERQRQTPVRLQTIELTSARPRKTDDAAEPSKSIGVLNPTSAQVFVGLDGNHPTKAARAISCPPNALLVLPVAVEEVALGVDADVDAGAFAGGDLVVFLMRFEAVQPAFLGRL